MDDQEREGARLLGELRGFEPPQAGEDLTTRAVHAGRRGARRRRATGAAASALAMSAVVVISVLAGREVLTGPPALGPSSSPTSAERFQAGRQEFVVGSAGGFMPVSYEAGADVQRIRLRPVRPNASLSADAIVEMYPKGVRPSGMPVLPTPSPTPTVNGRPGNWLTQPVLRAGAVELAWEWKPGAWGIVSLKGEGATRDRAHKIALSVIPQGIPDAPPTGVPTGTPSSTPRISPTETGSPTGTGTPTGTISPTGSDSPTGIPDSPSPTG